MMLTANNISIAIENALSAGRPLAIVSLMARGEQADALTARLLIAADGARLGGTLGDAALDEAAARYAVALMADDRKEIVVAGAKELAASTDGEIDLQAFEQVRLLFEISRPPLELIICGGGHVGQAVAVAGCFLDFQVTVIDDRAEFAAREKFPDERIRLIADDFVVALRTLRITPAAHIVIVTRGHRHDEICLQEVIDKPARYIGMIGSRRRTTTIRERLKREGIAPELLRRVHAPIGLDIGALTPEEIALAILAEIVLVRRGGTGVPKGADGPMAHAR
ncbi:MAG TPA: XdhC family protein [Blastocatellia bacterium]|nr:XdhC family protein [Blastocatellia bacterium]HMY73306.1 XdhC family protein [Blastocatellia bacterium]HMZ22102.1 XdhC family protein [Blastocatellia bacterium]HNG32488.1 XdhC family protein [Blastocatellia bacterium]